MRTVRRGRGLGFVVSLWLLLFVLIGGLERADGAEFPTKPIEVIVPAPPGGGTDIAARLVAEAIEPILKQKLVVINTPGGSGSLGLMQVVGAKPDGYTLGLIWQAPLTMVPTVIKVTYTLDDFSYITMLSKGANLFAARSEFPAKTAAEFFEYAGKNTGKLTYAGEGIGNTAHFAGEKVFQAKKVKLRLVPYGGSGESMKALLGGHVDIYGGSVLAAMPHIKAGKVKGIFVTTAERVSSLPDVPGILNLGLTADAETLVWRGILGPKGIPADRLAVLERAFQQAAQSTKVKEFLAQQGEELIVISSKEFEKRARSETAANGLVAKQIGLSPK
jgi:tripartite-type tricarboxylate transporter receptor subunit TctC